MNDAKFVYVTYIRTSPERVWNALLQPEFTRQYWDHDTMSNWKPESRSGRGRRAEGE